MLLRYLLLLCVYPTRGCVLARHDLVLHAWAALPLRIELYRPDALLGLPALGHERMVMCCVFLLLLLLSRVCSSRRLWQAAVVLLGSRPGRGRRSLYAPCLHCELCYVLFSSCGAPLVPDA